MICESGLRLTPSAGVSVGAGVSIGVAVALSDLCQFWLLWVSPGTGADSDRGEQEEKRLFEIRGNHEGYIFVRALHG